jgi:hypothetical protein
MKSTCRRTSTRNIKKRNQHVILQNKIRLLVIWKRTSPSAGEEQHDGIDEAKWHNAINVYASTVTCSHTGVSQSTMNDSVGAHANTRELPFPRTLREQAKNM